MAYVRDALDGLLLPLDLGELAAFIEPPNPGDGTAPGAYVWGSRGHEQRLSVPRAEQGDLSTGGDKQITHSVDVWLVWLGPANDPLSNVAFPAVIDAVMGALRNVSLQDGSQHAVDPVTGQLSGLLAVGEEMSWDFAPVRAVADQRYLRYDAQITCDVVEIIQA